MAASRSAQLLVLFLSTLISPLPAAELPVTARPTEDVILPCQAPAETPTDLNLLKWSRPGQSSGYVYFYRDGRLLKEYQHSSYRDRAKLKDPEMRNRDVSVVLTNVTNSDSGTYECLVSVKTSTSASKQYVTLTVTDEDGDAHAGNKDGRTGDDGVYKGRSIGNVENTAGGGNKDGYLGLALCVVSALVL